MVECHLYTEVSASIVTVVPYKNVCKSQNRSVDETLKSSILRNDPTRSFIAISLLEAMLSAGDGVNFVSVNNIFRHFTSDVC